MEIKLIGLEGIPLVKSGDDISKIIKEAILNSDHDLCETLLNWMILFHLIRLWKLQKSVKKILNWLK